MLITMEMLCQKDACEEGKALFAKLFGESVEYSVELHQKLFQLYPDFEGWLIEEAIIQPLCLQVGDDQQVHVGYCGTATAGDFGTAIAGYDGTATAGRKGTATAGDCGTAIAGDHGTAIVGNSGTATAGDYGTATAGHEGTATAGYEGTAIVGNSGTATAGDYGTATAGHEGTATAGDSGTATAGDYGKARAGLKGEIRIRYWDKANDCYRTQCGNIDGNILKANVFYKLDAEHQFVEV